MDSPPQSPVVVITLGHGDQPPASPEWNDFLEKISDPDGANLLINVRKVGPLPDFPELTNGEPNRRRIALLVNHHGDENVKSIAAFLAPFAEVRVFEIPEADAARFWLEN